jgi:hypothetical protein
LIGHHVLSLRLFEFPVNQGAIDQKCQTRPPEDQRRRS